MKPFALLFVLGSFAFADVPTTTPPPPAKPEEAAKPPEPKPAMQQESRTVIVREKDVIQVKAQLRVTTLIVLPQKEKVMTVYCGDKDNWVIDGMENFVTIKPSKQGAHTDVHILTDHANAYTLSLTEVSQTQDAMSDVKIFLQPGEDSGNVRLQGNPVFVNAQVAERYKEEAAAAKARAEAVEQEAQKKAAAEAEKFRASYPAKLHFDYTIERGKAPFNVSAIYRDDKFTYIRANPQEVPALYELKDGKPSLINYDFANGIYTIPKIIDAGYLAIGKQKLNFFRSQN